MWAFLTDPKLITAAITLLVQAVGQFGVHADPVQLTTVLSPLYLFIIAHAHAQSGQISPAQPMPKAPTVEVKPVP